MKKEYKGYFRKGWFAYTLIRFLSIVFALMFIYIGISQGQNYGFIVSFSGFMVCAILGALMSATLCKDYIESGKQRV